MLLAAAPVAYACDTPTETQKQSVEARISGPQRVDLGCWLYAGPEYHAGFSIGPIDSYEWSLNGEVVGQAPEVRVVFEEIGTWDLGLIVSSQEGAADTAMIEIQASAADESECASGIRVFGRHGLLLGDNPEEAYYRLFVPPAAGQHSDIEWSLLLDDEVVHTAEGSDVHSFVFSDEGSYRVRADFNLNGEQRSATWAVNARRGEPFLDEPGQLLVSRLHNETDLHWFLRYLDPESGFMSDPIRHIEGFSGYASCTEDGIIMSMREMQDDGERRHSLFMMDHDGTNLIRVLRNEGANYEMIDARDGYVFMVNDHTPLRFSIETGGVSRVSPNSHPQLSGWYTAAGPGGQSFALGLVEMQVNGETGLRIAMLENGDSGWQIRPLHTRPLEDSYGVESPWLAAEGGAGLAWDPKDEYLAYGVLLDNNRYGLARSSLDGSDVRLLQDWTGRGTFSWTPSGDYIMTNRFGPPVGDIKPVHLIFVDRDGTGYVDWSEHHLPDEAIFTDMGHGYCPIEM